MKKILLTLITLLTAAPLLAQTDTLTVGLCKGEMADKGIATVKGNTWVSAAALLGEETIAAYADNKISQIRVALCSRVNIDTLRVWVKDNLYGEPLAQGYITSREEPRIKKGWNVVDLEIPYTISGDPIYIGFDLKQRGSTSAISAVGKGSFGSFSYKESTDAQWGSKHTSGNLSIEANITGDNLPKYDLALTAAQAVLNIKTGMVSMGATVYNKATRPISSVTLTTTVSNQVFTQQFRDSTIMPGKAIDLAWTIQPKQGSVDGESSVGVEITDIGGETDIDPTNNELSVAMNFKRKVLIEEFTTEQCPNCPRVAGYLHTVLENPDFDGNVFAVAHHEMYQSDWLTLQRSVVNGQMKETYVHDYAPLYNDRGTYAPAMMFSRQPWFEALYTPGNTTPVFLPGSALEIESITKTMLEEPATIVITDLEARYGDNDTTLVVTVKGMRTPEAKPNARITVMLTEDNIAAHSQVGAEGAFTHQHVSRALNSVWGEPIKWDGNSFTYEVSLGLNTAYFTKVNGINFQEAWRQWAHENMNIVAAVNYYTTNVSGCYVENVEGISLPDAVTEVRGVKTAQQGTAARTEVYTIDGKRVSDKQLSHGIYIVRETQADGTVTTRKMMVR